MENLEYFENYYNSNKDKYKNNYLKYKYSHLRKCYVCGNNYLNIKNHCESYKHINNANNIIFDEQQ